MASERTYIMIKPDGVERGLVGEIISRFEKKGFKLVALKMTTPTLEFAQKHYADLSSKPFFGGLTKFLSSGPVICMIWEGKGVVKTGRVMLGATDPAASAPGTIRGDYAVDIGYAFSFSASLFVYSSLPFPSPALRLAVVVNWPDTGPRNTAVWFSSPLLLSHLFLFQLSFHCLLRLYFNSPPLLFPITSCYNASQA